MTEKEYELYKKLYQDGWSLRKISETYRISRNSLSKKLKEEGVTIKGNNPGQERRYTYQVNTNFFEDDSPNSNYVMGFFLADGSFLENGIKFDQNVDDKEILIKINEVMQSTYPIHQYESRETLGYECKPMCRLNITRLEFKYQLLEKGFQLNKTYSENNIKINTNYEKDFIRGFFDGDGSCSYDESSNSKYISFTIHNEDTANFILSLLKKNSLNFTKYYSQNKNCYSVIARDYATLNDFYNWIYPKNESFICLERKRIKLLKIINMWKHRV